MEYAPRRKLSRELELDAGEPGIRALSEHWTIARALEPRRILRTYASPRRERQQRVDSSANDRFKCLNRVVE